MIWHIIFYLVQKLILTVDDLITGDFLLEVDIHTYNEKKVKWRSSQRISGDFSSLTDYGI